MVVGRGNGVMEMENEGKVKGVFSGAVGLLPRMGHIARRRQEAMRHGAGISCCLLEKAIILLMHLMRGSISQSLMGTPGVVLLEPALQT